MKKTLDEAGREAILDGIRRNLSYAEIAARLGVRRGVVLNNVKAMRRSRDPDLRDAQRTGQARADDEKQPVSQRLEERFHGMTGMTLREKSFRNMVHFYRFELMTVLRSDDREDAIRSLPKSTRRTLKHNGILTNRKPEITKRAQDQLLGD